MLIITVVVVFFAFVVVMNIRQSMVFLSNEAMILPKIEYTTADLETSENKYNILHNPQSHKNETVTLTSTEVNLILKEKYDLENRLYVQFADNRVSVQFSLPVPLLGRFANGACLFDFEYIHRSPVDISIDELVVNELSLDEKEQTSLEGAFESFITKQKSIQTYLRHIESISIDDDVLVIRFADNQPENDN